MKALNIGATLGSILSHRKNVEESYRKAQMAKNNFRNFPQSEDSLGSSIGNLQNRIERLEAHKKLFKCRLGPLG